MNYYEHHLGDYLRDAGHLSMVEDGAYRRLLDAYYIRESALPGSIREVCRIVRATTKAERTAVETVLREFFDLRETGWHHSRCDREIERYQQKREKARKSADARWSAQKSQCETDADAMRSHSEGNALQSPVTSHQILDDDDNARARSRSNLNEIETALREAAGESLDPTSTGLMVLSLPLAWAADGCDFELDVLPAIRAASARASPGTIRSWKYFTQAVADAKARRLAPMPEGRSDERPDTAKSRDARARENHLIGIQQALAARRG